VKKLLVVRLRSIGDTVLATPTLRALRRQLPSAKIDILLEDWVAPLIEGHEAIDSVRRIGVGSRDRWRVARELRRQRYDVVINLHGGTTSSFITRATGAPLRIGYEYYQYSFLYNLKLLSPSEFWLQDKTHSAEQQLALAGFAGIDVADRPEAGLPVSDAALQSLANKLEGQGVDLERHTLALMHPAASYFTKTWQPDRFARVAEYLSEKGLRTIAVGTRNESEVLEAVSSESRAEITTRFDLTLPEITALASKAKIFIGNDSGIAHIAAAVSTPPVVIFGSSNRDHWKPWTRGPHRSVFRKFDCQPCPGRECLAFGVPKCILDIEVQEVISAVDELLEVDFESR